MSGHEEIDFEVGIISAELLGSCFRCHEPMMGNFNHNDEGDRQVVSLKCINCGAKAVCNIDVKLILEVVEQS